MRKAILLLLLLGAVVAYVYLGPGASPPGEIVLTGFVEGEERILRSEVTGRVLDVLVREGAEVLKGQPLVRIDPREAVSRREQQALQVRFFEAEARKARETLTLTRSQVEGATRVAEAELAVVEADRELAETDERRERDLRRSGAGTGQALDDAIAKVKRARAASARAREALALARDRAGEIRVAEAALASLEARVHVEAEKQHELDLLVEKHEIRASERGTVQSRLIRGGELAQPGRALLSVLDEDDKYVKIYIPVPALHAIRIGTEVEVELDSDPGTKIPGVIEWIDAHASFTPRKVYTRDDRVQQVYEGRARLLPGSARRVKAGAEASVRIAAAAAQAKPPEAPERTPGQE